MGRLGGVRKLSKAKPVRYGLGEAGIDVQQMRDHAGSDVRPFDLAQLEGEGVADVFLLDRRLAQVELPGLAVMVGEAFGAQPALGAIRGLGKAPQAALRILARSALGAPAVRLVVRPPLWIKEGHVPVLLEMCEGTARRINGEVGEVRAAQAFQLGVEVGEVATLQERVVGKVDARWDVLGAEGHLLGFGEEVVDHAIQHQPTHNPHRQDLLRDDLGGIEDVEVELVGEVLVEQLQSQLPFREGADVDRIPQIAAVEIGVRAVDLYRLVPHHRLQPELGFPVELDEGRASLVVEQTEGVDAETLHETERARDRAV